MQEMTPEEGQEAMDEWFKNLPVEVEKFYSFLSDNVKKFQTFDLLSYISYYNHLHDTETYTDFRGDKNFFVSEVLALLCLKSDFVNESTVSEETFLELLMEIQNTVLNYCGRNDALEMKKQPRGENTVADVASLLSREAKHIRNPGLPDHHLIFTEKLFEPIKDEIKSLLGFSISDSVIIRKLLPDLINKKCNEKIDEALSKGEQYANEIIKYRETKTVGEKSYFTKEQFEEYSLLPEEELKQGLQSSLLNKLFYNFSSTYTFTETELADFTKVELQSVKAFLKQFSCGFPSLKADDKIYEPITILKTKPFIEHNGQYLVPSLPLLVWAVEDAFEIAIKGNQKLSEKYPNIKHEFLLKQGLEFFKTLLPTATFYPPNLFYTVNSERCESDALIIYDRVFYC